MIKNDLKVLLVVPNFRWTEWDVNTLWHYIPYNLCLLASMIRDICDVKILDANIDNLTKSDLADKIKEYNPNIIGITILMDQYGKAGHISAQIAKEVNKDIITIFGGVYATINSDYIMKDKNIDIVVIGEGEYILRNLVLYFKREGNLPVNGISYRKDGLVINTGHSSFISDLDKLPLPAYDLVDLKKYIYLKDRKSVDSPPLYPYMRIFSSRGCPIGCTFCQVKDIMGKSFRKRSAENVLKEIRYLMENYGIKSIIFDDDNLIMDRQRAIDLFKGLKELKILWLAIALAAFKLDKGLFKIMKECGCIYVDIAIESASPRILKDIIKKPINLNKIKEVVSWGKEFGIFIAGNFMIGFPTETWEEIRKTIKFAEELDMDYVKIFDVIPLRHTELWDMCEEHGHFKKGFNQKNIRWNVGQLESNEYNSNDLTILRAYEWDRINFSSKEKIEKIANRMNISCDKLEDITRETRKNVVDTLIGNQ
ncbi:MAG: radical SAM protein [Actinobacteria bacterium]|nr:radical SAM protein [Actinomycetota bacterium]MBE3114653.1 radical SAM protein [Actinomycetota bacterium]